MRMALRLRSLMTIIDGATSASRTPRERRSCCGETVAASA
jgi:hypothetical protein